MRLKAFKLDFKPALGCSSKHFQTIVAACLPAGKEPPTTEWLVDIGAKDYLSCQVSIPPLWSADANIAILVHGLGGSHKSPYMIRMARKLYQQQVKVVRVNLRNCGTGKGLSKRPYHGGNSQDIEIVVQKLKEKYPHSNLQLIGYSLGANIVLKLAAELGQTALGMIKDLIAVCPPLFLEQSVAAIQQNKHKFYHAYYLRNILKQASMWAPPGIKSLFEFDNQVTAPQWGYKDAKDYYAQCSSGNFLNKIKLKSHILLSQDDPFIPKACLSYISATKNVHVYVTEKGGHMGFISPLAKERHWLDSLLLKWISGEFASN